MTEWEFGVRQVGIPLNVGRVCSLCGQMLPATSEYFSRVEASPCGLNTRCKACVNGKAREAGRERTRQWREWEWQRMSPAQREREIERQREAAERKANRTQRQSDMLLATSVNSRTRGLGNEGTVTAKDIAAIRKSQTDKRGRLICWRCRKPITGRAELDHFIPASMGGPSSSGNLHFMCADCNRNKRNIHPHDLGMLI